MLTGTAKAIQKIFNLVSGTKLGRVVITKLEPGASIQSHRDHGKPVQYYQRFHLAIQNEPGSVFTCGTESFTPEQGQLFWFNNELEHSVQNNSAKARITLLLDIRTKMFETWRTTY